MISSETSLGMTTEIFSESPARILHVKKREFVDSVTSYVLGMKNMLQRAENVKNGQKMQSYL